MSLKERPPKRLRGKNGGKRMRQTDMLIVIPLIAFGSLIAYADSSELDRVICNGDETCLQDMQLGKINERIENTRIDLQMANQDLEYMIRYDGVWGTTDESRDWYQGKRGIVCSTNRKVQREIPQAEKDLGILHLSSHPGIANRANLKLRDIQSDPVIKLFLTETPCQRAKETCKHFGCTEIIDGSL